MFESPISLISAHFVLGLLAGFSHCILMCHPFVLHISSVFSFSDSGYRILLPNLFYNFGRTFTYSIMGAIAGGLGSIATYTASYFLNIQKFSAILGGSILLVFAILYFFNFNTFLSKLSIVNKLKTYRPNNSFLYGVFLGFLPCGLSMGAVIGTIPSNSWYLGALMMTFFGIGTSCALMMLAVIGTYIMRNIKYFKYITAILFFIMGISFIYKGVTFLY